jgi:hypothetical protein
MSVDFNYHGNPPFSWEVGQRPVQHGVTGDFITGETGLWAFSALGVGLSAAFYRATAPGRRVQAVMQRGVRHYHDQTTRPLNDIRWETMTLLAHGSFVTMVDKTAYDGWLDPVFYQRLGEVFREAHAKRGHFGHPVHADVGIYFSHRTRDWRGREDGARAWQGFLGAHKALVYAHIPWGVVLDENVGAERLRDFPVVLLPNVGVLLEEEVDALASYVEGGGNLLVTGATGLFDRFGNRADGSVLSDLIGAEAVEVLGSVDNHVRLGREASDAAAALAGGIPSGWPFLVQGAGVVYRPTTAAAVGELMKPHRTVRQRAGEEGVAFPMSADAPAGPAALVHRWGNGKVVTLACSPGEAAASDFQTAEARKLLVNAVRFLVPEPSVSVVAPQFVESVVTTEEGAVGSTVRVHLIARPAPPAATPPKNRPYALPQMLEDTPIFRAEVRLPGGFRSASAVGGVSVRTEGESVHALVEDVHAVIVVER